VVSTTRRRCSLIGVPFAVLAYGENLYKSLTEFERVSSVHAEDNVIRKLPQLPKNKKPKRVDMLVIRVNKSGMMANSKPCIHCLMLMVTRLPAKGYTLSDVYFSNSDGTLTVQKLSSLLFNDEHHVSRYHKERGTKISLAKI
jgi:hypothetical protein